jgi:endonuclease/exonuclease/phosphatase family metal-dependent hydrolase
VVLVSEVRFRVATFNIHGGRPISGPVNLPAITDAIQALEADVVALQEVHHYLPPPGVFQDQPRRLQALLDRPVTFRRSFGMGKTGYGNALVSNQPPERVRRHLLPSKGEQRALVEYWLTLHGQEIRVLNTHFGLTSEQRLAQSQRLVEVLASDDTPTVLLGDLNAEPDSPEIRRLVDAGLRHAAPTEVLTFPCDHPTTRIDYVLVTDAFKIRDGFTVATPSSDHLPLVADLVLP